MKMILSRKTTIVVFVLSVIFVFTLCGTNLYNLGELPPSDLFVLGKEYYFEKEDYDSAQILFNRIARLGIVTDYADSAQFLLAESYFKLGNYILAESEYDRLIRTRLRSPLVPYSRYMIGMSYYNLSPSAVLDQEYTNKAIEAFQEFIYDAGSQQTPALIDEAYQRLIELHARLAEKDYLSGVLYRKMGFYDAAIKYLDYSMISHSVLISGELIGPLEIIPKAQYEKGECYIKLDRFTDAQEAFQSIIDNFPDHYLVKRARDKLTAVKVEAAKADTSGYY